MTGPPFTLENALCYLKTDTWDGSGMCIHPDVIFSPDGFKGGLPELVYFIQAQTPYPYGDNTKERPNLIVSKTKNGEFKPYNIPAPIHSPPSGCINSDSDIVYAKGQFYYYYRETKLATSEVKLLRQRSENLVHWANPEECRGLPTTPTGALASPAIFYEEGHDAFVMYNTEKPGRIVRRTSLDGLSWSRKIRTDIPKKIDRMNIWHVDAQKLRESKKVLALICYCNRAWAGGMPEKLYFAESDDGIHFTTYDKPILAPKAGSWDSGGIYRSTFAIFNGKFMCWYSGATSAKDWHTGYTETDISHIYDKDDATFNVIK